MRVGMEKLVLHLEIKKRIREGRWLKKQNLIELEEDYNHLRREISRGRMRNPLSSSSPIEHAKTNTKTPCCSKVGLKRGPWTPEEDELLSNYIKREGEGRWRTLPKNAGLLRCGKSCRLRWMNYLRPSVKRGQIAPDEEDLILRLHRLLGNRWSLIAGRIPGRTDNEIKNYWNTHLSKKLISQGIDPRTHRPLNPDSSPDAIKAPSSSPSKANNNLSPLSPDIARSDSTPLSDPKPPAKTNANGQLGSREGNAYFPSNLIDHHHHQFQTETVLVGYETLPTSANGVLMATLRNNNGGTNDEDEDINYCSEDVFSSFLNSLIDEDALGNHHQTLQQLQLHGIAAVPPEPLINLGFAWDQSTLISQPSNQHMDRTQEHQ